MVDAISNSIVYTQYENRSATLILSRLIRTNRKILGVQLNCLRTTNNRNNDVCAEKTGLFQQINKVYRMLCDSQKIKTRIESHQMVFKIV